MSPGAVEFRPTLDPAWLAAESARDPVLHAYVEWDLLHHVDRIRLVSAMVEGRTAGYLLIWLGHPTAWVVHWIGDDPRLEAMARQLPPRPLVAIVPDRFEEAVRSARGPLVAFPLLLLLGAEPPGPGARESRGIRRLRREDRWELVSWAARQADPVTTEYRSLDPEMEAIWGAFEGERLVGVVRAAVRLPRVWVLGGVYVEPSQRGSGLGRALLETVHAAAANAGAPLALYVREDRSAARSLYESLGFRTIGRRVWLDAGSGLRP